MREHNGVVEIRPAYASVQLARNGSVTVFEPAAELDTIDDDDAVLLTRDQRALPVYKPVGCLYEVVTAQSKT